MEHSNTDPVNPNDQNTDRRLIVAILLKTVVILGELFGGIFSGSLTLVSDAAHNTGDALSVVLALGARRLSRRPPTLRHTYGFKRAEVIAALANALLLLAAIVLIAREAVVRIFHPEPVNQGIMLTMGLLALFANAGSALLLRRHDKDDLNIRGTYLHLAQDALGSLSVVLAALFVHTRFGPYLDPLASLFVGFIVLRGAISLLVETLSTLLEGAPRDLDLNRLAEQINDRFKPSNIHHLHVWEINPGRRLLTAHISLGSELDPTAIMALLSHIKEYLHDEWGIDHATLEPETLLCRQSDLLGRWTA